MARDGCFLGLKPIAEAMELKLRPPDLDGPDFSVEYDFPLGDLDDRDHQVRGGVCW
jgi:hypothetical protein